MIIDNKSSKTVMSTEENNQVTSAETSTNESESSSNDEVVKLSKSDYDKMNQTLGSLKRELKDLKKPKEETREENSKTTDNSSVELLQKAFLRSAQITDKDEVELALTTSKKWGVPIDEIVDDEDFKLKLDKLRTQKSNELATSNVRGDGSSSSAKSSPDYWIAKGVPPTAQDVPDRKTRAKIARAMMEGAKSGKKFYSD